VKTQPATNETVAPRSDLIALVFVLSRIGRLNQLLLSNVQAELKKSAKKPRTESECFVLISLMLQGEPYSLSPTTLCAFSLQTPGGMTKTLNRLEGDSLIRRRTDRGDRRALLVELTAKGLKSVGTLLDQTLRGYADAFQSHDAAAIAQTSYRPNSRVRHFDGAEHDSQCRFRRHLPSANQIFLVSRDLFGNPPKRRGGGECLQSVNSRTERQQSRYWG